MKTTFIREQSICVCICKYYVSFVYVLLFLVILVIATAKTAHVQRMVGDQRANKKKGVRGKGK